MRALKEGVVELDNPILNLDFKKANRKVIIKKRQ